MKNLKKLLCAFMAVAMMAVVFAGCDGDEPANVSTPDDTSIVEVTTTTAATTTAATTTANTTGEDSSLVDDSSQTATFPPDSAVIVDGTTGTGSTAPLPAATNLKSAVATNADSAAWIKISGTFVDYPVLKTSNNSYYLNRDINKKNSKAGSLFIDYRTTLSATNQSSNILIYGHNMANGSYFGSLNNYKQLKFYKNNPYVTFNTTYKNSTYVIVACFYANTVASDDNGVVFNYHNYQNFATQADFDTWKANVKKRSWYTEAVDYNKSDKYITLSTCTNTINNGRLVVVAREVRSGEKINTSNFAVNPSIYFPQDWKTKYGTRTQP